MASESSIPQCLFCQSNNLRSYGKNWRCADCGKQFRKVRTGQRPNQRDGFHLLESDYEVDANGCWLWKWSQSSGGYAQVRIDGRLQPVHRWTYEQLHGPIPGKMDYRHGAGCPRHCVNPVHGKIGTRSENLRDMVMDGNQRSQKLTTEQAQEVYELAWSGKYLQREIGRMYGVGQDTVSHIKHGRTWNWIEGHLR